MRLPVIGPGTPLEGTCIPVGRGELPSSIVVMNYYSSLWSLLLLLRILKPISQCRRALEQRFVALLHSSVAGMGRSS